MEGKSYCKLPIYQQINSYTDQQILGKVNLSLQNKDLEAAAGFLKLCSPESVFNSKWHFVIASAFKLLGQEPSAEKAEQKRKITWSLLRKPLIVAIQNYTRKQLEPIQHQIKFILQGLIGLFNEFMRSDISVEKKKTNNNMDVLEYLAKGIARVVCMFDDGYFIKQPDAVKVDILKKIIEKGVKSEYFLKRIPDFFEVLLRPRYELLIKEDDPQCLIKQQIKKLEIKYQKKIMPILDWIALNVHSQYLSKYFVMLGPYFSTKDLEQIIKGHLEVLVDTIKDKYLRQIREERDSTQLIFSMIKWNILPSLILFQQIEQMNKDYLRDKIVNLVQHTIEKIPSSMWLQIGENVNPKVTNFIFRLLILKYKLKPNFRGIITHTLQEYQYIKATTIIQRVQKKQGNLSMLEITYYISYLHLHNSLKLQKQLLSIWNPKQLIKVLYVLITDLQIQQSSLFFLALTFSVQYLIKIFDTLSQTLTSETLLIATYAVNLIVLLSRPLSLSKKVCICCFGVNDRFCLDCQLLGLSFVWPTSDYELGIKQKIKQIQKSTEEFKGSGKMKHIPEYLKEGINSILLRISIDLDF